MVRSIGLNASVAMSLYSVSGSQKKPCTLNECDAWKCRRYHQTHVSVLLSGQGTWE